MNPGLLSKLLGFVQNPSQKLFTLTGKAGTGKTQTIKEIQDVLNRKGIWNRIATPTNKASSVLKKRGLQSSTIHKLLFISTPVVDEEGNPVEKIVMVPIMSPSNPKQFLLDGNGDMVYQEKSEPVFNYEFNENKLLGRMMKDIGDTADISKCVLIIDESSMIPARTWKNLIENTQFKIVVVGDKNQLEPVEGELKRIRDEVKNFDPNGKKTIVQLDKELDDEIDLQQKYKNYFIRLIPDWVLEVNHRTKSMNIKSAFESLLNHSQGVIPSGIFHDDIQTFAKGCKELTEEVEEEYLLNSDITIAWQNKTVNELNNRIREIKYPSIFQRLKGEIGVLPMVMVGEPLYVETSFIKVLSEDNIIFISKGEIIRAIESPNRKIDAQYNILYTDVCIDSTGEIIENLPIDLTFLGYRRQGGAMLKCRVSFAYAITCHKAQGGQWKSVLVWDDLRMPTVAGMKKWRYTAITRAEDYVAVFNK